MQRSRFTEQQIVAVLEVLTGQSRSTTSGWCYEPSESATRSRRVSSLPPRLLSVQPWCAVGDASDESAGDITQSSQTTPSQSSDDYTSSGKSFGKTSTATETTHPRELPTTGTGGELQQQTPVDLHGFALLGLAFRSLALLIGSLAVKATR
jgi:hypothetical protein